ncbi:uncharacterized protein L201_005077 [Kwoniella dendrophila CBS 6074]|uniref:Uncharacterized protein n=1 Tax=Kwoniella dendrophila CBS 6074 TaxID=1295534 RepID=A0AAX4JZ75_9TREE
MGNPAGVVILLNGYPGVGKSSVAKELVKILPNAKLLEYHSLRAVIDPLIDREEDTDRWMEMKKVMIQTILNTLARHPPSTSTITTPPIYILTSHLCATPRRLSVLHSHLSDLPLIHILLNCSTEENLRRLKCTSRLPLSSLYSNNSKNGHNNNNNGNGYNNGNNVNHCIEDLPIPALPHGFGKITDESLLYELRMEEELGKFYSPYQDLNSGQRKSTGMSSSLSSTKNEKSLKDKGLLGEFEINTEILEINQTALLISEYIIESTRNLGWFIRLNPVKRI